MVGKIIVISFVAFIFGCSVLLHKLKGKRQAHTYHDYDDSMDSIGEGDNFEDNGDLPL